MRKTVRGLPRSAASATSQPTSVQRPGGPDACEQLGARGVEGADVREHDLVEPGERAPAAPS